MDHEKRLRSMIETMVAQGASDLHLGADAPPIIRVSGNLIPLVSEPPLTKEDTQGLLSALLSPENKARFEQKQEIDFSYAYGDTARFRGNGYVTRGRSTRDVKDRKEHR